MDGWGEKGACLSASAESNHVVSYGCRYFFCLPILSKILLESSIRANQVHDNGVINLNDGRMKGGRGEGEGIRVCGRDTKEVEGKRW